jgi:hypothetical protein
MMRFIAKRKAAVLVGLSQNCLRLRLNNSMLGSLKPSKERINIDELLESGLFKKY